MKVFSKAASMLNSQRVMHRMQNMNTHSTSHVSTNVNCNAKLLFFSYTCTIAIGIHVACSF